MANTDLGAALWAAHRFRRVSSSRWPAIASQLVADGYEGPAMLALASLSPRATAPDVEPLLVAVFDEFGGLPISDPGAGWTLARMLAQAIADNMVVLSDLDGIALQTGRDVEPFASASHLVDLLDSGAPIDHIGTALVPDVVGELRSRSPLDVDPEILQLLVGRSPQPGSA